MENRPSVGIFFALILIGGCSSGEDEAASKPSAEEHVWKEQTQALGKAKGVDQLIQSAADKQNKAIEEQSE